MIEQVMDAQFQKKLSDELFESAHKPMLNLYVDVAAMFDYKLTALLALIKTEKEFEYINSCMKKYSSYKGRKITTCFPALKITEEQINAYIKDPKNHLHLAMNGIITNITNLVPTQIIMFQYTNSMSPIFKGEKINVHFVNELFDIPEIVRQRMRRAMEQILPGGVECHFRHGKINQEQESFLIKMDHLILDDMESFAEEGSNTYKILLIDRKLIGSSISATYRLSDEEPWMEDEGEERIKNSEQLFRFYCFFMFFDKQLIMQQPEPDTIQ